MEHNSGIKVRTVRFLPGQELKQGIEEYVKTNQLKAAFILTCVGSLKSITLRYATPCGPNGFAPLSEKVESFDKEGFEICSLVGTVSEAGSHLHAVLGRADGSVVAGHVVGNAEVLTTAEVVIGDSTAEVYTRVYDPVTSYKELQVSKRE